MKITEVHISEIKVGDTIIHHGQQKTVCRRAFGYDSFIGVLLWGDSYNMGNIKVKRVTFPRWYKGIRYD